VLWAAILIALALAIKLTLWRRGKFMVAASFIVLAILLFKVRGARNQEFEGIWEKGFDRSGFHNKCGVLDPSLLARTQFRAFR